MKKLALIALVFVLTLSLCACGRRGDDNTTGSTTESTSAPTVIPMPSTNATLDPTPDTSVPGATDGTNSTDATGGQNTPGASGGAAGNGNMIVG